jgi:hypothetical protein
VAVFQLCQEFSQHFKEIKSMGFTPGPLMQALSKLATAGNNFYESGWGDGNTMPVPTFDMAQQQQMKQPTMPQQGPPIIALPDSGHGSPQKATDHQSFLKRMLQTASQRLPEILSQYSSR